MDKDLEICMLKKEIERLNTLLSSKPVNDKPSSFFDFK